MDEKMSVYLKNSCFNHIPKTGGRWIKVMIQKYVEYVKIVGYDDGKWLYTDHSSLDPCDKIPFYFVREPSSWVASLWKQLENNYARSLSWVIGDISKDVYTDDFDQFVDNICQKNNWVSMIYSRWTDYLENPLVGKIETLNKDFLNILKKCNEKYDSVSIMNSTQKYRPAVTPIILTTEQKERIIYSNKEYCERYDYE